MHVLKRTALVFPALLLLVHPASPQGVPVTEEQRQAGNLVERVEFDVDELVVPRDGTATLEITPLDAAGTPLGDAPVMLAPFPPRLTPVRGIGATVTEIRGFFVRTIGPGTVEFTGDDPGPTQLEVFVFATEDQVDMFGVPGRKLMGALPVRVLDWPAAAVELDPPAYRPYVGTSQQLSGRVITDRGTESVTAQITAWRSSDPSVATISSGGVFTALAPGEVTVTARTENDVVAEIELEVVANPVSRLSMSPLSSRVRTGDVVQFDIVPVDGANTAVTDASVALSVSGLAGPGGFTFDDGTFVAEEPGAYRVIASVGSVSSTALVEVEPRDAAISVERVARGVRAEVATSDLWVFEGRDGRDYAYTGTHAQGGGERMFVWDVTEPTDVVLVDSVVVDARVVNDVKVSADASWAIITREGSSNRRDGIIVLDLEDPAHPTVMSELTDSLTGGIHNVWIMGDVVYAVNDGTGGMNIIDMSDPTSPRNAGRWDARRGAPDQLLHDVWARDGYAYLSYFEDGMIILDVGAGTHGGTPLEPALVSSITFPENSAHTAWRNRDYVFVGDEIVTPEGMRGFVHIVDVSDIENPREVAKYEVPEAGAHNVWVENDILYIAYYDGGLRMVDVSGTLRGDLYRQGREIGVFRTAAPPGESIEANTPQAWGPQVHKGHLFVSDMYSGLWVLRHEPPARTPVF